MEYSLKKLSKTFDQKLTNPIRNAIRIGFISILYIPAGGIFSNVKKDKENSKCLFEGNFLKFILKKNLAFLIFLTKF